LYVEFLPYKLKNKLHMLKNLWTPWRLATITTETCRSTNWQIKSIVQKLVLNFMYRGNFLHLLQWAGFIFPVIYITQGLSWIIDSSSANFLFVMEAEYFLIW